MTRATAKANRWKCCSTTEESGSGVGALAARGASAARAARIARAAGAVLFELAIQGFSIDREELRGERSVVTGGLEDAQDVAALDLFERHDVARILGGEDDVRRLVRADFLGQIVDRELVVAG